MFFVPDKLRECLRISQDKSSLPSEDVRFLLEKAGLRPTRQRIILGNLLFFKKHRHITADDLYQDVRRAGITMSLATIYNTLNQFSSSGLLRKIIIPGEKIFYDTNPESRQHFYIEEEQRVIDIPSDILGFITPPSPPDGYIIEGVEIVIRLSRNR